MKTRNIIFEASLFCLFVFVFKAVNAQNPNLEWTASLNGAQNSSPTDVKIDALGNSYVIGNFSGTMDFDPGSGIYNVTSSGSIDAFLLKLDPSGNFLWVKIVTGPTEVYNSCLSISSNGEIYVGGNFTGTSNFDPGLTDFSLTATNDFDFFILKYNETGAFQWAKQFGGMAKEYANDIAVNDQNNTIVCVGQFEQDCDFDPNLGSAVLVANSTFFDGFVLNLDLDGNYLWSYSIGGDNMDVANSLALDASNNIIVGGHYRDSVNFDFVGGNGILESTSNLDQGYVLKITDSGQFVWVKNFESNNFARVISVGLDVQQNVLVSGYYSGTLDFNPGTDSVLYYSVFTACFTVKLDMNGDYTWGKPIVSSDDMFLFSSDVSSNGDIYLTGNLEGTANFDTLTTNTTMTSVGNSSDAFVVRYSSLGEFTWVVGLQGQGIEWFKGVAVDNLGAPVVVGVIDTLTSNFSSNLTGGTAMLAEGRWDVCVLKINNLLGLNSIDGEFTINIYPNPTQDIVTIETESNEQFTTELIDSKGLVLSTTKLGSQSLQINMEEFESGVYYVRLSNENQTIVKKLVKR